MKEKLRDLEDSVNSNRHLTGVIKKKKRVSEEVGIIKELTVWDFMD